MIIKESKAQSILEYVLLMAAVILAVLTFVLAGPFRNTVGNSMNSISRWVSQMTKGINY